MKGFYFSLDALLAISILLAIVSMLIAYPQKTIDKSNTPELDYIHTSTMQPVDKWNNSYNNSEPVIEYIYSLYYSGNLSKAETVCNNYFAVNEKYAVFFVDKNSRDKVCGTYNVGNNDNIKSSETIVPDISVNKSFYGPKKAVMVIQN